MKVKVQETWRNLLKNPPPETRPVEISPGMSISSPAESPAGASASSPGTTPDARQGVLPGASQRISRPSGVTSRFTRVGANIPTPQSPAADNKQPAQQPAPTIEPAQGAAQGQDMANPMGQPAASQVSGQQPADAPAGQAVPAENAGSPPGQKESKSVDQIMQEFNSSKVTDDEADRMEKLIQALQQAEQPAQGRTDANSAEPNAPANPEQ